MQVARRAAATAVAAVLVGALLPTAVAAPGPDPAQPVVEPTAGVPDAAADDLGQWQVVPAAPGTYTLTWRAPDTLPLTDARPEFLVGDTVLGPAELGADGRTLRLDVATATEPDPDDLSVVLSGRVLDSAEQPSLRQPGAAAEYVVPPAGRTLATDPGTPGDRRVVSSDYRLPARRIAGMPAPVEMRGHVVRPADTAADHPLVLFLHGRHQPCFGDPTGRARRPWPCPRGTRPVPSHLGYDYAQRLLASQGYVTVSISANGINAQDFRLLDGGAAARATLVRRHLAHWASGGQVPVDLRKVVLVGHSRGGEGVNTASVETSLAAPYRIVGQILLAPTNFARKVAAYVPTVTVLPYCDGDVSDLQGQTYTDLARDLTDDDTALRSSVLMMGANHNFFNTEWTPGVSVAPSVDDGRFLPGRFCKRSNDARLGPGAQRAAGRAYIAGAVRLFADADASVLPMFDGSDVDVPSARGADVRTHALGLGRDLRRPGAGASLADSRRATTQLCVGRSGSDRAVTCGRGLSQFRTPHWLSDTALTRGLPAARAFEMRWRRAGAVGGLRLARPIDLSTATSLDLRTAVDPDPGSVRVHVRLHDGSGRNVTVTPASRGFLRALPGRDPLSKVWAQTLRVPLAAATGIDLTDVVRVDLVGHSAHGRVWVLDLAATRAALAPVPVRRLPRVDLGRVRVREGDGNRTRLATVPFTVSGVVREPATFIVVAQSFTDGAVLPPRRVSLSAGQRAGTFTVPYPSDDRDDRPVQTISAVAWPVRGLMTGRGQALVRVLDDDPAPEVRVRRVASRVTEGAHARWRVRLSEPVDYAAFVVARVVGGPTALPRLRVADVPPRWRRNHLFPVPPASTPLHRARPSVSASIRPGRTDAVLRIPLRRDGRPEGREAVSTRIRVAGLSEPVVRTVTVVDRR